MEMKLINLLTPAGMLILKGDYCSLLWSGCSGHSGNLDHHIVPYTVAINIWHLKLRKIFDTQNSISKKSLLSF